MLIIETQGCSFVQTPGADVMSRIHFPLHLFARRLIYTCFYKFIILGFILFDLFSFFMCLFYLTVDTFNLFNVILRLVTAAVFKDLFFISYLYVSLQYFIFLMVIWVLLIIFLIFMLILFLLIDLNSLMRRLSYFLLQTMFLFLQILIFIYLIN